MCCTLSQNKSLTKRKQARSHTHFYCDYYWRWLVWYGKELLFYYIFHLIRNILSGSTIIINIMHWWLVWHLGFWQSKTAKERLDAFVYITTANGSNHHNQGSWMPENHTSWLTLRLHRAFFSSPNSQRTLPLHNFRLNRKIQWYTLYNFLK